MKRRTYPFPGFPELIATWPPEPKLYCDKCGMGGYYVRSHTGEVFFVGHDGTRWCSSTAS